MRKGSHWIRKVSRNRKTAQSFLELKLSQGIPNDLDKRKVSRNRKTPNPLLSQKCHEQGAQNDHWIRKLCRNRGKGQDPLLRQNCQEQGSPIRPFRFLDGIFAWKSFIQHFGSVALVYVPTTWWQSTRPWRISLFGKPLITIVGFSIINLGLPNFYIFRG